LSAALFVLSLLFGKFAGASAAGHGASGGLFAGLSLIAGMALVTYAWTDNDMSAERVGAASTAARFNSPKAPAKPSRAPASAPKP
jgi:hypothetical protein